MQSAHHRPPAQRRVQPLHRHQNQHPVFQQRHADQTVWYYEHPYPGRREKLQQNQADAFEEFQTEIDWWGSAADGYASRQASQQAWPVSIDDIKARNYNLDIKNPHVGEQVSHDPDELLAQYQRQLTEIRNPRRAEAGMAVALGGKS